MYAHRSVRNPALMFQVTLIMKWLKMFVWPINRDKCFAACLAFGAVYASYTQYCSCLHFAAKVSVLHIRSNILLVLHLSVCDTLGQNNKYIYVQ